MTQAATERASSLRARLRRAGGRAADFSQPDADGGVRERDSRSLAGVLYAVPGAHS